MTQSTVKIDTVYNAALHLEEYENAGYETCKRNEAVMAVTFKAHDGQKTYYFKKN